MKIVCISGKAQHGKDTTAKLLEETLEAQGNRVLIAHYGDLVKYVCKTFFGWDGKKDEKGRTLLQRVGTDKIRAVSPDYWVDFIVSILDIFCDEWDYVLIPDTRFPNEYEIYETYGMDAILLRVVRPNFVSPLTEEQQKKVLHQIDETLKTPFGPVLFAPPYTKYNGDIGRITAFAPGTKENAAIFIHGGAFKIVMDYFIGRAEDAYKTMLELLPNAKDKDIELYKTEPYVFPEYAIGPGNPRYGEGSFTWLTGSADWFFVAVTQYMLGARPTFKGLLIDPCIPASWGTARITRRFRGTRYEIRIRNPNKVSRGVREIKVDGAKIDGNLLPEFHDHGVHIVDVLMGLKK